MIDSICCIVHENIYLSILCVSFLYISFIVASLCSFFKTLSWLDLASYIILFIMLSLLGGRFLLLNTGLSKDVYNEVQSYAEVLLSEKPDLLMIFPFIQKIENPENVLNKLSAKNIPVNIYCNKRVTELQCAQVEKFIMDKISGMGGKPYADLQLSIFVPTQLAGSQRIFSKTISINAQKNVWDICRWVKKAFPLHQWLGKTALIMLFYLQCINMIYSIQPKNSNREPRILFLFLFSAIIFIFFGFFYFLNNFHHEIFYCHMLIFLIIPYALLNLGYWNIRYFFQSKLSPQAIAILTQFFSLYSILLGLFLLVVDYHLD